MKDSVTFRAIHESEITDAFTLHNNAYKDNRTEAQWDWEYRSCVPNRYVFMIAQDKNHIVGTQGMIPIYINIKGERVLSGKSENSLLDKEYRGRDIFQRLYEHAMSACRENGMHCVWGYTPAIKVMRHKMKFSVYEDVMYESILTLRINSGWKRPDIKIFEISRYVLGNITNVKYHNSEESVDESYKLENRPRSKADIPDLYKRLRKKYPNLIHMEQDEKYLSWRIYKNPNLKYATYFVYDDKLLRGYCYVSMRKEKVLNISDIAFENIQCGEFLMRHLYNQWLSDGIVQVRFFGNTSNPLMIEVFKLFKMFGFIKKKSSMSFVLKNINYTDTKILNDIKNWYIDGLWTEGHFI